MHTACIAQRLDGSQPRPIACDLSVVVSTCRSCYYYPILAFRSYCVMRAAPFLLRSEACRSASSTRFQHQSQSSAEIDRSTGEADRTAMHCISRHHAAASLPAQVRHHWTLAQKSRGLAGARPFSRLSTYAFILASEFERNGDDRPYDHLQMAFSLKVFFNRLSGRIQPVVL
jgi:hypothetical protein